MTGLWIALAAIVLALGFGAYRAATDGRFRSTSRAAGARGETGVERGVSEPQGPASTPASAPTAPSRTADLLPAGTELGDRATLVQFSSAFCAPCRTTRRILADVAERHPGVVHVEIDAELHLETVRALDILRTPTTLILDASGREVARAAGAPRPDQVVSALPAR